MLRLALLPVALALLLSSAAARNNNDRANLEYHHHCRCDKPLSTRTCLEWSCDKDEPRYTDSESSYDVDCVCDEFSENREYCQVWSCDQKVPPATCFPAAASVRTPGGGEARMDELEVGSMVEVPGGGFEPVVAFLDRRPAGGHEVTFVEVEWAPEEGGAPRTLRLSPAHVVPGPGGAGRFASELKAGDVLLAPGAAGGGGRGAVASATLVRDTGAYAPLTPSGELVVGGARVSCYANFRHHRVAHAAFAPLRWWLRAFPGEAQEGVHPYAAALAGAYARLRLGWLLPAGAVQGLDADPTALRLASLAGAA